MQERKAPAKPPRGHSRLDASCWKQHSGGQDGDARREWEYFFIFCFVTKFFRKNQGERQCRKRKEEGTSQRKLEIHLMFPKLEKKKYKTKTDLFHLLASCHA